MEPNLTFYGRVTQDEPKGFAVGLVATAEAEVIRTETEETS